MVFGKPGYLAGKPVVVHDGRFYVQVVVSLQVRVVQDGFGTIVHPFQIAAQRLVAVVRLRKAGVVQDSAREREREYRDPRVRRRV